MILGGALLMYTHETMDCSFAPVRLSLVSSTDDVLTLAQGTDLQISWPDVPYTVFYVTSNTAQQQCTLNMRSSCGHLDDWPDSITYYVDDLSMVAS